MIFQISQKQLNPFTYLYLELKVIDNEVSRKIDIGFPQLRPSRSEQLKIRLAHVKAQRKNPDLEKLARAGTRNYTFL